MSRKGAPPLPDDLEKELQDYYGSPEPGPEFISRLERGLHSKLKEQEQKQMSASAKRKWVWAFGLAVVAVLIGLLATSPTVVAAMKRLFGYIPDAGLVETQSPLRVLAEPVSQTRDGITITVEEAVLSADKTSLTFTVENIPFDKLSHREDIPGCGMSGDLRLPDASTLRTTGGQGQGWGSGYEYHFTYAPIPADVNEATLLVPCIQDVLPGVLPENWELPLRFVPAPPGFVVAPVIEITPSQEAGGSTENPFTLTKVIETETGYILIGEYHSSNLPQGMQVMGFTSFPRILDADGNEILYMTPNDVQMPSTSSGVFSWAAQLDSKSYRWPLKIVFDFVDAEIPDLQTEIDFDTGLNPQAGQVWEPNRDIQLGEYSLRLETVRFNGTGYTLKFKTNGELIAASADIVGYSAVGASGGGSGQGDFETSLDYDGNPPIGLLKIRLSRPSVRIRGPWTVEWQPDNASILNSPTPTEAPQACLNLDAWKSALANATQLPANLTGKVISYAPVPEYAQRPRPENYGIVVSNLDGSSRQVLGNGVWPSLSPDGTRAAYAWEDGLYVADLDTGESHLIPNTNGNDYNPRWSPDGTRLAFVRIDDFNLYLINPDGTGLQKVTSGGEYEQLVDWSADGASLLYGVDTQQGISLRKVDIASGAISNLFVVNSKGPSVAISPDGNRIAFLERAGELSYSLYVSNIDGSARKLIGNLGHWVMIHPLWSSDGKWLMVGVLNTDLPAAEPVSGLIGLENCQVIPLHLSGEVYDWIP